MCDYLCVRFVHRGLVRSIQGHWRAVEFEFKIIDIVEPYVVWHCTTLLVRSRVSWLMRNVRILLHCCYRRVVCLVVVVYGSAFVPSGWPSVSRETHVEVIVWDTNWNASFFLTAHNCHTLKLLILACPPFVKACFIAVIFLFNCTRYVRCTVVNRSVALL